MLPHTSLLNYNSCSTIWSTSTIRQHKCLDSGITNNNLTLNPLGNTLQKTLLIVCGSFPRFCFISRIKPGSYFLQMQNAKRILTSQGCFRWACFAVVEQISTLPNYSLRNCDIQICKAFSFTGSMNQALGPYLNLLDDDWLIDSKKLCIPNNMQLHNYFE